MPKTSKPNSASPPSRKSEDKRGFAAFIDLRDSTYVWNQNADIAEEILQELNQIAVTQSKQWGGKIGNFTGDGFLLLFEQAEFAIRGLAAVITAWEARRAHYRAELEKLDVLMPDEHSLILRTGVAFGNYREISSGEFAGNVAGEAINHASRCEGASKLHFDAPLANAPGELTVCHRVFIAASVYGLVSRKTDYWSSQQLKVEHKGYEQSTAGRLEKTTDYIYACWPKADQPPAKTAQTPQQTLQRVANAAAKINAADRLLEARNKVTLADELSGAAQGALGKTARDVLTRAIAAYREGLKAIDKAGASNYYAATQHKLGYALWNQASLLAGEARATRLDEAVHAYREALKVYTLEAAPADYAMTQNNLGNALWSQANLLAGEARVTRLDEAVHAYGETLKVYTLDAAPADYAMTQTNLGVALGDQAELLVGDARAARLDEAVHAFREALKVRTLEAAPADYAMTQNNLGAALRNQAALLAGKARATRLDEAVRAYREALKVRTLEAAPVDYAMTQENLGLVLCDQAELLAGQARAARLDESREAFENALKVFDAQHHPHNHQKATKNLARTLGLIAQDRQK